MYLIIGPFLWLKGGCKEGPPLAAVKVEDKSESISTRGQRKFFTDTNLYASCRFGRVWFTKPVVWCAAMQRMAGRTDTAGCRHHTNHVLSASIAQAFVFELGKKSFKLGQL